MKRNSNIELWRCFCMFAVVLGHVLVNNGVCSMDGFRWHIPGFLLISGYFGIKLRLLKIIKLILVAYLCYWLTIPLRGGETLTSLALPHGGWFLPFYCVLVLLSPILNAALENEKHHKIIMASVVGMVVIAWVPTIIGDSHAGMLLVPGMQGNGLLLMIAIYVVGAILRVYHVATMLSAGMWFVGFVVGTLACVGLGTVVPSACHYLSPVSIVTAICGFMAFVRMPELPCSVSRAVNFISPSMFGVYLLHECCLKRLQYLSVGGGNHCNIPRNCIVCSMYGD